MILNSDIAGTGHKQLVILHGLYGSSESWSRVANLLGDEFTVHLIDQRNHGKSFHSPSHNYSDLCEDLKFWAEFHGLKEFYLAGHSMGGKTAMFFTSLYPEMVKKLVVADISPRSYSSLMEQDESVKFHLNLISLMKNMPVADMSTFRQASEYLKGYSETVRNVILKNLKKDNERLTWKININAIFENLPEIMSGLNPDDFIDNKINTPTLFLKAADSGYITNNDKKLTEFIFTDVRTKIIENAGHWLHYEQPEKVAAAIKEFLD